MVLDVLEALEEMDEAEFDRERVLRGTNMPRTSSGFMEELPLIVPHAGRDICGKVGGLATAVMREGSGGVDLTRGNAWKSVSLSWKAIACGSSDATPPPSRPRLADVERC